MACSSIILSGIALDCGVSGGCSKLYLVEKAKVSAVAFNSAQLVTGMTITAPTKLTEYNFRKGNCDFAFKATKDSKLGSTSVESTINLTFNKMEQVKRNEIEQLLNGYCYAVVKDNNGLYWLVGYDVNADSYLEVGTVDGATGAELTDGNQYKLALMAKTTVQPFEVDSTIIAGLL
jgi:hypothetical protein